MMKSHWVKRIVRLLILLFGVSILCFVLTALSSTDPATYIVRRGNLSPTPEAIEQVRVELGLDQPLLVRYINWIGGALHGDFGESIFSTNEVAADLACRTGSSGFSKWFSKRLSATVMESKFFRDVLSKRRNKWAKVRVLRQNQPVFAQNATS